MIEVAAKPKAYASSKLVELTLSPMPDSDDYSYTDFRDAKAPSDRIQENRLHVFLSKSGLE